MEKRQKFTPEFQRDDPAPTPRKPHYAATTLDPALTGV